MSNELLKQYPSGFLGSSIIEQTEINHERRAQKMINQIMNRPDNYGSDSLHKSSVEINSIWAELLANTELSKTFEFKGKVLAFALVAFGTEYFAEWTSSQSKNTDFTEMHHKFIDDTINYVAYGKRREISLNNWVALLDDSQKNNTVPKYTETQAKFFLEENPDNIGFNNESLTIEQLIHKWVSRAGGIEDLTLSLFVLFGDR